jgi:WhiB family redox-sensing transcriptional regulator
MTGGWRAEAACRGHDPNLFFAQPGEQADTRRAKAICAECPVVTACLQHAIDNNEVGVWGRTTTSERHGHPDWQNRPPRAAPCGTSSGYDTHRRNNQPPGPACRLAKYAYKTNDPTERARRRRQAARLALQAVREAS